MIVFNKKYSHYKVNTLFTRMFASTGFKYFPISPNDMSIIKGVSYTLQIGVNYITPIIILI
jgi:hypothetical protein